MRAFAFSETRAVRLHDDLGGCVAEIQKQIGFKRCPECYEIVPYRVKICPACRSYQDWRRYVSNSQTALAVAAAVLSLLTALVALTWPLLQSDQPKIRLIYAGPAGNQSAFMVRNDGKAGASIRVEYIGIHPGIQSASNAREAIVTTSHDGIYVGPSKEERFLVAISPDAVRGASEQFSDMGLLDQYEMVAESDVRRAQRAMLCVFYVEEIGFTRDVTRSIPVPCEYQHWLTEWLRSKINGPRED